MRKNITKNEQALVATDWVKVSRTRRSRGYSFEDKVRGFFNRIDNEVLFHCRRLGGSSVGLPDLIITYNNPPNNLSIIAMECKSRVDGYVLEIPQDQVYRCVDTLKAFNGGYKRKYVGFGFKFRQSIKCKRKKGIERYWLIYPDDGYIQGERGNLMKVTYDIRTDDLTFWYADGMHRSLPGSLLQQGWCPDIYRLADLLEPDISHNERQIRQDRRQDTVSS